MYIYIIYICIYTIYIIYIYTHKITFNGPPFSLFGYMRFNILEDLIIDKRLSGSFHYILENVYRKVN